MIRNTTKYILLFILQTILILSFTQGSLAEESWLPEFEELCSMTEQSEYLSKDELKTLVSRCEKLRPIIDKSESPQRKVYLFRLDKCKNLFLYVLEVSEGK